MPKDMHELALPQPGRRVTPAQAARGFTEAYEGFVEFAEGVSAAYFAGDTTIFEDAPLPFAFALTDQIQATMVREGGLRVATGAGQLMLQIDRILELSEHMSFGLSGHRTEFHPSVLRIGVVTPEMNHSPFFSDFGFRPEIGDVVLQAVALEDGFFEMTYAPVDDALRVSIEPVLSS